MAKIDYNIFGDPRKGQNLTYQMKNMRGIMQYHLQREIDNTLNDIMNSDNGFDIESLNLNKLITDKMKDSIAKKIEETLTPFYTDEFYSTLRYYGSDGVKLRISPWWDDVWQEIKLRDLVKEEIDIYEENEKEDLIKLKEEFDYCSSLIEAKLNKIGE